MIDCSPATSADEDLTLRLSFRRFAKEDNVRCAELAAQAWPEVSSFASGEEGVRAMKAYLDFYRVCSNWQEVVCISDKVIGLLFGKIDGDIGMWRKFKGFISQQLVYMKFLIGLYGRISNRRLLIRAGRSDDAKIRLNRPEADGEVTFFVVDQAFRGMGIGRTLMDRFLRYAASRDARLITVYTTDPGSNWQFYEIYGFERCGSFRDAFTSFARKEEVQGLIYGIDISPEDSRPQTERDPCRQ